MPILANFNLLALSFLKPGDLSECLGLRGAGLLKLKLAELPHNFFQHFLTFWVSIAKVTTMMSAMETKPSRRPDSQACKGKEDEKL